MYKIGAGSKLGAKLILSDAQPKGTSFSLQGNVLSERSQQPNSPVDFRLLISLPKSLAIYSFRPYLKNSGWKWYRVRELSLSP